MDSIEFSKPSTAAHDVTFQLATFGCKVNTYDSGLLEARLQKGGFSAHLESARSNEAGPRPIVHILNSCAVTGEATQEAIRQARKLKREDPNCLVVMTGCAAQVDTDKLVEQPAIDLIVANSHKTNIVDLIRQSLDAKRALGEPIGRVHKSNIFKHDDLGAGGGLESSHTRAYLKIQDGCNSFCTFCVIPFARGKSRSLPIEDLRRRTNELLAEGAREIVLTGVHIGDYEFGLENLIEDLLLRTRVPRLRLTSLEPIELSDRLLELYADPRLCPHFHMSIQSASTSVLHRMKRKYSSSEVITALHNIYARIPSAFVGMDVIAGFPAESEAEFADTYGRLVESPWTRLHVFPYSERPGTYAARLKDKVDPVTIARRASRLRELSRERYLAKANEQIGSTKKVLVLRNGKGLTRDYWNIELTSASTSNCEVAVRVTGLSITAGGVEAPPLIGELA